jgi:fatty acid synthase, animal type
MSYQQVISNLGRVLFPGTGWLVLVWETFCLMSGLPQMETTVVFEAIKFLRATSVQKDQDIVVTINIHRGALMV